MARMKSTEAIRWMCNSTYLLLLLEHVVTSLLQEVPAGPGTIPGIPFFISHTSTRCRTNSKVSCGCLSLINGVLF